MVELGFVDVRIGKDSLIVPDGVFAEKLKDIHFVSRTISAFKLPNLEDKCEDFGQVAVYKGGITDSEDSFDFDSGHHFAKDTPSAVCGASTLRYFNIRSPLIPFN